MGRNRIDLTGQRFGRLVVLRYLYSQHGRRPVWLCHCDCGKQKELLGDYLNRGQTQSCGCLQRELSRERGQKRIAHGHGRRNQQSPTYQSWYSMKQRCLNPKHGRYKDWGGRGIKVCGRWLNFENFLSDMGVRPAGKTIDRIDNDGDYGLDNCKWSTSKEQSNNRRVCVKQ